MASSRRRSCISCKSSRTSECIKQWAFLNANTYLHPLKVQSYHRQAAELPRQSLCRPKKIWRPYRELWRPTNQALVGSSRPSVCRMLFPNFRRIFREFRSEEEERELTNAAFFKFCGFVTLVMGMLIGRTILLTGLSKASA